MESSPRINIHDEGTSSGGAEESDPALPPPVRWTKDHPEDQIIGDLRTGVRTRKKADQPSYESLFTCFISKVEPKKIE